MIVTLTANPSLDRTIDLASALVRGGVQRARSSVEQPGGKGVNVSRALIASSLDTLALLPGDASDPMLVALRGERIPCASVTIPGRIRSNITVTEPDGTTTKVNEPGPALTEADAAALVDLVVRQSRHAEWVVLAGSLPPGLPVDFYSTVIGALRAAATSTVPKIAVDSSGAPLRALIDSGIGVDLIKPNADELAELTGIRDGDSLEDDPDAAYAAANALVKRGVSVVLATLGAKGGILATAAGGWIATMPPVIARSTVGAGDASLAGYLVADARGADEPHRLAQAVAHGSAAASLPGSTMPSSEQTDPASASLRVITASQKSSIAH